MSQPGAADRILKKEEEELGGVKTTTGFGACWVHCSWGRTLEDLSVREEDAGEAQGRDRDDSWLRLDNSLGPQFNSWRYIYIRPALATGVRAGWSAAYVPGSGSLLPTHKFFPSWFSLSGPEIHPFHLWLSRLSSSSHPKL